MGAERKTQAEQWTVPIEAEALARFRTVLGRLRDPRRGQGKRLFIPS